MGSGSAYYTNKNGETKSLTEWGRKYGISVSTLYCRIKRGMSIDEAIEATNKRNNRPTNIIYDQKSGETHTLDEWAEITGKNKNTLYTRIFKHKWPVEKALYEERYTLITRKPRPQDTYKHIDLKGQVFGKLTVLRRADNDYVCMCKGKQKREWKWLCECSCENHTRVEVIQHNLLNGHTTNCGCENPSAFIDLTGKKFDHLTVIKRAPDKYVSGKQVTCWYCICDCGNPNMVIVPGHSLRTGHTTSCGCRIGGPTHGLHNTGIYRVHQGMLNRCRNEKLKSYDRYGKRGIYVCDEWNSSGEGFMRFYEWAMANGYQEGLSIDRIDNDGPYAPWNCRWTTMKVQANNKSNNVYITYNGETKTASEWAEQLGVNPATLLSRHKKGWTDEDIIEIPVNYNINLITTSFGVSFTISKWSEVSGIKRGTIYDRIFRHGWHPDKAVTVGATNPEVYSYIPYGYDPVYAPNQAAPVTTYTDILGNHYTQQEWEAHQAVFFD